MTFNPAAMGAFEPLHAAHAIEQVQIAINLARPLEANAFLLVREAMSSFAKDLPGTGDVQNITIAFGQQQPFFAGVPSQVISAGFLRQRLTPSGGIQAEVRCDPSSITLRTTVYTRWKDVWEEFGRYLKAVIGIYVRESPVMQVSLNVVDKFYWSGEPSSCQPKLLLRPNSRFVCPYVYDSPDLWHSHTGAFIPIGKLAKRLINLNVDYLDEQIGEQARRIVSIGTVVTDLLNQPGYEPLHLSPEEAFDKIDERVVELHVRSKDCFGDVISDGMCKRIALSR